MVGYDRKLMQTIGQPPLCVQRRSQLPNSVTPAGVFGSSSLCRLLNIKRREEHHVPNGKQAEFPRDTQMRIITHPWSYTTPSEKDPYKKR